MGSEDRDQLEALTVGQERALEVPERGSTQEAADAAGVRR